jgi:hypothetical protein
MKARALRGIEFWHFGELFWLLNFASDVVLLLVFHEEAKPGDLQRAADVINEWPGHIQLRVIDGDRLKPA